MSYSSKLVSSYFQSVDIVVNIKIIFHLMDPTKMNSCMNEGCGQQGINREA